MTVRSYKRRASRVTRSQQDALDRLWSRWGVEVDGRPLDLTTLFGRESATTTPVPVVLEIGSGMGEATAEMATAQPELALLVVEVHTPGIGSLLRQVDVRGLTHVRVADGDAVVLVREMLAPHSLAGVRIFFPDPWPKARHAKRRLLDEEFVTLLVSRLARGAVVHVATDITAYAAQARSVLAAQPLLAAIDAPWRPRTRFEGQGLAAGRQSVDLAYRRL